MTQLAAIAKNTAVILKAASGDYTGKLVPDDVDAPAANDLQVSDGTVQGNGTIYALAKKNGVVGFYKVADGEKVPAGKAYLKISSSAPAYLGFESDATGIEDAVKSEEIIDKSYYNLNGQRVAQPTKGLYIVNGKKVVLH